MELNNPSSYKTMEDVAAFIQKMKFKKKTFGGVDELSVIRKMEDLQKIYRSAYEAQAAYYQALLDGKDKVIAELRSKEVSNDG